MGATTARKRQRQWSVSDLVGARLAIYTRASDDPDDTQTSVMGQSQRGEQWAQRHGCLIPADGRYCDNDLSASPFATKPREDFERLLRNIEQGRIDLLWFWTLNRSQRKLSVYVQLRDLCQAMGVGWVIKNRLYDLNDPSDLRALGVDAVNGEVQSIEISQNVRLGMETAAALGKPHSKLTYGYRRIYDERGRYVTQVPDLASRTITGEDGSEHTYSKAAVAREILTGIAEHRPQAQIANSLMRRGIPNPSGAKKWHRGVIAKIARNPAYIGLRVYQGKVLDHTRQCWPTIFADENGHEDDETIARAKKIFYEAQSVLNDPERKKSKPGRGQHLLSYSVRCDVCGEFVTASTDRRKKKNPNGRRRYACAHSCASIDADDLDQYVMDTIDAYFAREDVQEFIASAKPHDEKTARASAEVDRLNAELEELRQAKENTEIDLAEYLRFSAPLKQELADAQKRATEGTTSQILRLAADIDWANIPVARKIVAKVADIRVLPVGRGRKSIPAEDRITWQWLVGPEQE